MATDKAITVAARLDRLPPSRHTRRLVTLLSLGGWFEFYDLFFTAYVAIGLFKAGLFKPTTQGLFDLQGFASFVAALFLGLFVGTLAFSWLSDRFGRRSIFTFALLWYSIGALIMAFQNTPETIDLWRFIASVGLGVELVNIDTYVSELVPKEQRGPAFAYNQFVMFTAVPVVAFLAWQLVPLTIFGLDGWRVVVIIGSVGAFAIWWIRRKPAGIAALARTAWPHRAKPTASSRIWNAASAPIPATDLPPPEAIGGEAEHKSGSWMEMWSAAYRGRTIMLVIYNLFQTIGYYGFSSWVPTLLIAQGIGVTKSLTYTFVIAVAAPIGPLIGVYFADVSSANGRSPGPRPASPCSDYCSPQQSGRRRRHRLRRADHAVQQLDVVLVPRLSGRALSDPHPRPGGRLCLFVEPVFRDLFRLHHRVLSRPLRHHRRLRFHCRRHGHRVHRHRSLRAGGHQAPSRSHRGVMLQQQRCAGCGCGSASKKWCGARMVPCRNLPTSKDWRQ